MSLCWFPVCSDSVTSGQLASCTSPRRCSGACLTPPRPPRLGPLPPLAPCSQWTVGVGYTAADYQAALLYNDAQKGGWGAARAAGGRWAAAARVPAACCRDPSSLPSPLLPDPHALPLTRSFPLLFCCPAATAMVAHKVTADTTIGAEVVRDLAANTTSFAAGACRCRCCEWLLLLQAQ